MTDTSAFSVLPLEILDQIIDLVKDCSEMIKTCTLVNHDWALCARRRLFQSFTFPPKILAFRAISSDDWLYPDNSPEEVYSFNAQNFARKLESLIAGLQFWPPNSAMSLATIVRSLTINGIVWPVIGQSFPPKHIFWQGLFSQLPFTELRRIHIRRITRDYGHTIDSGNLSFHKLLEKNSNLESLVLESVHFSSVEAFVDLFYTVGAERGMTQLQSLSLVDIRTSSRLVFEEEHVFSQATRKLETLSRLQDRPRVQILKLSDLHFQQDMLCAFIPTALFSPSYGLFDLSSLHTLMLTHCESGVWHYYKEIFVNYGSTVTSLKVDIWPFDLEDQGLRECLKCLVNLLHLEIRLDCAYDSIDSEYPITTVNTCLPLVPTLEHLSVVFRVLPAFQFEFDGVFPPKPIESALSNLCDTTNPYLTKTAFDLNVPNSWNEMNNDDVRECMPIGHSLFI